MPDWNVIWYTSLIFSVNDWNFHICYEQQKVKCFHKTSILIVQKTCSFLIHLFISIKIIMEWPLSSRALLQVLKIQQRKNSTFRYKALGNLCLQALMLLRSFLFSSPLNTYYFISLGWNLFTMTQYLFMSRFWTSVALAPHLEVQSYTLVQIHNHFLQSL